MSDMWHTRRTAAHPPSSMSGPMCRSMSELTKLPSAAHTAPPMMSAGAGCGQHPATEWVGGGQAAAGYWSCNAAQP